MMFYLINPGQRLAREFDDPARAALFMWGRDSKKWLVAISGQRIRSVAEMNPEGHVDAFRQHLEEALRGPTDH